MFNSLGRSLKVYTIIVQYAVQGGGVDNSVISLITVRHTSQVAIGYIDISNTTGT